MTNEINFLKISDFSTEEEKTYLVEVFYNKQLKLLVTSYLPTVYETHVANYNLAL